MGSSNSSDPNQAYVDNRYNGRPSFDPDSVMILDTTLREGEQASGVAFTTKKRLQIAWMLDYFGVDAIEISPIISLDHKEACRAMVKAGLSATIVAHVRALTKDVDVALACDASWLAMYHSTSDIHLQHKLRIGREEALIRAVKAVQYAKSHGVNVRMTLEDASRSDPDYLIQMARAVSEAGVDRISIPDTIGVMHPKGMFRLVQLVRKATSVPLDVHCHNDLGLAMANAIAGIEAGANQIHVSVNGLGERVGIVSLAEAAVALIALYGAKLDVRLDMLKELSDLVASYTGIPTPPSSPIVGDNAYRHKAGTHVAAMLRNSSAYEAVPPRLVGNRRRIVFGELSGKNGAAYLLKILGLSPSTEDAVRLAEGLKNLRLGDLFELNLSDHLESEVLAADRQIQDRSVRK